MKTLFVFIGVMFLSAVLSFESSAAEKKKAEPAKAEPQKVEQKVEAPAVPAQPEVQQEPKPAEPAPAAETKPEEKKEEITAPPAALAQPVEQKPAEETPQEEWVDQHPYGTIGLGIGIFYGFFGLNVDVVPIQVRWWDGITITLGAGQTNIGEFAYNAGIRYHVLPRDYWIRPRISVTYGVNALTDYNITILGAESFKEKKTHHGVNVGAGVQILFGKEHRHGLDFDLIVIAYSTVYDYIDDLKKQFENDEIKKNAIDDSDKPFRLVISCGYRFAF